VKLSSQYRLTAEGPPRYADVIPMAKALISANPERVVWGTDWPHPMFQGPLPNAGDLIDSLADWTDDAAVQHRILVDNPAVLYDF
jgi:predicted TIM-barrel fold metal-dependent hydrolase